MFRSIEEKPKSSSLFATSPIREGLLPNSWTPKGPSEGGLKSISVVSREFIDRALALTISVKE
jgi:hypothetical protein